MLVTDWITQSWLAGFTDVTLASEVVDATNVYLTISGGHKKWYHSLIDMDPPNKKSMAHDRLWVYNSGLTYYIPTPVVKTSEQI